MKIELTSTNQIVTVNGIPVRIWTGQTETGIKIHAMITRIAVDSKDPRGDELKTELEECHPPLQDYTYPLRLIL